MICLQFTLSACIIKISAGNNRACKIIICPSDRNLLQLISLLEYCTPEYSLHFNSDFEAFKNVQRVFTRNLLCLCKLAPADNEDQLHFLSLQRFELRRIYFDLVIL